MRSESRRFSVSGPLELQLYAWLPDGDAAPKAVVQIVHGMAEHAARYEGLARQLTAAGYAVYATDQRGHGRSVRESSELGFLAERDGWQLLVEDQHALNRQIGDWHPGSPRLILGHSMGSFVVQNYLGRHGDSVAGAILSGTSSGTGTLVRVAEGLARIERLRIGARGFSTLLKRLSFDEYNGKFAPTRTDFDWLNRDAAGVDAYIADPLCGFDFSVAGWLDVFRLLIENDAAELQARVPAGLAVYLFAGDRDPVTGFGKGPRALAKAYQRVGLKDVTLRLYAGGRHEMLHETNHAEVEQDLVRWLAARWP
jgi:alpha-beta hydrolase superfamily lysophospholipase